MCVRPAEAPALGQRVSEQSILPLTNPACHESTCVCSPYAAFSSQLVSSLPSTPSGGLRWWKAKGYMQSGTAFWGLIKH